MGGLTNTKGGTGTKGGTTTRGGKPTKGGKGGKGKKGKGKWAYGDQDVIKILIKRYTAIDLLNALIVALGVVVNPKTKGKGKKKNKKGKGGGKASVKTGGKTSGTARPTTGGKSSGGARPTLGKGLVAKPAGGLKGVAKLPKPSGGGKKRP